NEEFVTIDDVMERYEIPFILFSDEIQELYVGDTNPHYDIYVKNISTILEIGKNKLNFGVISGSSSRLKNMIFKKNEYKKEYENYPNLNDTVFNNDKLLPIRNKEELTNFLHYKYAKNVNNDDINLIYYNTGGLIGIIESYISNDLKTISKRRNIYNYMEIIYNLIDSGFIYEINSEEYEFLYPKFINLLNKYFNDFPKRMELMALEGTLSKWGNKSSPGHSNEDLIKRYIFKQQCRLL
ncbi:hypothetical protein BY458DRAFT_495492, partial [Sporodiniella umbellata]